MPSADWIVGNISFVFVHDIDGVLVGGRGPISGAQETILEEARTLRASTLSEASQMGFTGVRKRRDYSYSMRIG